jgi:hypothetical protein
VKAEIIVTEARVGSKVLIDGLDVAGAITDFQFRAGVGQRPVLYLDGLGLGGAEIVAEGVEVEIPETVQKLLIRLGWIPPEIARTYFTAPSDAPAGSGAAPPPTPTG